jgi:hypothetical protein
LKTNLNAMSLPILLLIMLSAGVVGGIINWVLPANLDASKNRIQSILNCTIIGIGATILIPLFLEIAQSKLLDNIRADWSLKCPNCVDCMDTITKKPEKVLSDTNSKIKSDILENSKNSSDVVHAKKHISDAGNNEDKDCIPLKSYLLFAAYCFLAAAAGPRFINGLIDSVLKDKQIADLNKEKKVITQEKDQAVDEKNNVIVEKEVVSKEKDELQKIRDKLTAQNQQAAKEDLKSALNALSTIEPIKFSSELLPKIGPITNPDDPQKGRFGGKSENNGRALRAKVKKSPFIPDFFDVSIWVESTEPEKPLNNDVILYLHDSFRPSVYTIPVNEFKDGKALDDEILAWGAFTVGAVVDNGETLLELDLAEQPEFPDIFRSR